MGDVTGLLLAAGAGRRMGGPKALLRRDDGTPWVVAARQTLLDGGLDDVLVVLGAAADEARSLLGDARSIVAEDWDRGMGASLETGLRELAADSAQVALVHLVDLPDVDAEVVRRVLSHADGPETLARAVYAGAPGHPVLIGRDHWSAIADGTDDEGARAYLATHDAETVECGDLASGTDRDRPQDLDPRRDI